MRRGLLFFCVGIFIFICRPLYAMEPGKVVIVSISRTSLQQAAADPAMAPWLGRGSVGLLNITTASRAIPEHLYVTMGAGSRATGGDSARLAFNREEEYTGLVAREVFARHMGREPQGDVVHLGMAEMHRINQVLQYPVQVGLLGEALREAGKVTAILGNADGLGPSREASLLLVDGNGQINRGNVGRTVLKRDSRYPFGWKMDREQVWQKFQILYTEADVILLDWGDFARLNEYRPLLSASVSASLEEEIFRDVSWLLTRVFALMAPEDVMLIVSPVPPTGESAGGLLGYLVAVGRSFPPGGLLTSATTRRPGLAAATDVAPLVLEQLGEPIPGAMLGRTIGLSGLGGVPELLQMQTEIDRVFRLRPPLLKTYVFFQIVIVLGALLNMFIRIVPIRWFEPLLLGLLSVPLLLLILPLYRVSMVAGFAWTIVAVVGFVFVLRKLTRELVWQFAAVAVPTALLLVTDLLRDAPLMKVSVLGYDPVSGARYYGLGNEYMGVLVGTAVLGAAALITLLPRFRRVLLPILAFFFLSVMLLVVSPAGGANFGGTVTALIAFLVTLIILGQIRPGWRSGLAIFTTLGMLAGVALFLNMRVPQSDQSHLGRTVDLFREEGRQALLDVISRKASMNVRLFRYSQWSRAFLAFLVVLSVLFYRPRGVLRDLHKDHPDLAAGFFGIIAGSATAFLMNDSGVVAAATTLIYAGVPIIMLTGRAVEKMTPVLGSDK
jgi:hypothetical protein